MTSALPVQCPACHQTVPKNHPYGWCPACGSKLPYEVLRALGHQAVTPPDGVTSEPQRCGTQD